MTRRIIVSLAIGVLASLSLTSAAHAQTNIFWNGNAGTNTGSWNTTADWWTTAAGPTNPAAVSGATIIANFNGTGVTAAQVITLDASQVVQGIIFTGTDTGGETISTGAGTNTLTIGASGIVDNLGSGADTLNPTLVLSAAQTWTNNSANTLSITGNASLVGTITAATTLTLNGSGATTVSGVISNGGGTGASLALTYNGTGSLTLTGANTFTGATTLTNNLGTDALVLDFSAAGAPANNVINNSVTITNNNITTGSALTVGGGTLRVIGATTASTTNSQAFNGTTFTAGASVVAFTGTSGNTIKLDLGAITRTAAGAAVNFTQPAAGTAIINTVTPNPAFTGGSNTILGGWAVFTPSGNSSPTTWATSAGIAATAGPITGLGSYTVANASTAFTAAKDIDAQATNSTALTTITINSLRFNTAVPVTVTGTAANTITVASGGILETAAVGNNAVTITGGNLTTGNTVDLLVNQYNTASPMTIGAAVTGTTGLTLTGGGTLVLGGVNTYTGGTRINGGTLQLGDGTNNNSSTYAGIISGSGGVVVAGPGTISFSATNRNNTYTGNTVVNGGTLILNGGNNGTGTIRGILTINAGGTVQTNTKDQFGFNSAAVAVNAVNINGGTLTLNIGANNETATGVTFNMTGGTISSTSTLSDVDFFNNGFGNTSLNTLASSSTAVVSAAIGLRENSPTITVAQGTTASGVDLLVSGVILERGAGTGTLVKAGPGTMELTAANAFNRGLTINGGTVLLGNPLALRFSPVTPPGPGNFLTFAPNLGFFSIGGFSGTNNFALFDTSGLPVSLAVGGSNTSSSYGGVLSGPTSAIYKLGSGSLALTNTNTYGGGTTVFGGTLVASGLGALGTGPLAVSTGVTFADGNALDQTFVNAVQNSTNSIVIALGADSANNLDFSAAGANLANAFLGAIPGSGATAGTFTYSGTLTPFNNTYNLGGGGTLTISSTLSGTNTVTIGLLGTQASTVALAGNNTYSGGTTINQGTVLIGVSNALDNSSGALGPSAASVTLGASAGGAAAALLTNGAFTFANSISVASGSIGTLSVGGATASTSTFSGGTITLDNNLTVSQLTGGTLNLNDNIALGSGTPTLTFSNAGTVSVGGTIGSGPISVVQLGAGATTLGSANSYIGATTVIAGTLTAGATGALGTGPINVLGGTLSGTASGIGSGNVTVTGGTLSETVANALNGSGQTLTVNSGTATLSQANGYTGGTTVNGGTLAANVDGAIGTAVGTGIVTVNGGTLSSSDPSTSGGSPLGAASVTLSGGKISFAPSGSGLAISLAAASGTGAQLNYGSSDPTVSSGGGVLSLNAGTNTSVTVTVGSSSTVAFNRVNNGTLVIASVDSTSAGLLKLGSIDKLIAAATATAPTLTNGIVTTSIVGQSNDANLSGDFVTYGVNGFSVGTPTNSGALSGGTAFTDTRVFNMNAATALSTAAAVYALKNTAIAETGTATISIGDNTAGHQAGLINNGGSIASPIAFGAAEGTIYTSSAGATISGAISGTGGITVFGPGTLILSGTNTYSGGSTHVEGGATLSINSDANLGSTAAANNIILDGGTLKSTAGATITPNVNHGFVIGPDGATINASAGFGFTTPASNSWLTGTGTLTLTGSSTTTSDLIISSTGAQTGFAGNVTINSGRIQVSSAATNPLGTGTITIGPTGELFVSAASNYSNNFVFSGTTNGGNGGENRGQIRANGGNVTVNGSITMTGNSGIVADANARVVTLNGQVIGPFTLSFGTANGNAGGVYVLANSNNNNGQAATTLGIGRLQITSDGNLGIGTGTLSLSTVGGSTLQAGAASIVLNANRPVVLGGGQNTTIDTQGNTMTINGPISETAPSASLTELGAPFPSSPGTLVLGGANTYTGPTTVGGGVLQLAHPAAVQNSTVVLGSSVSSLNFSPGIGTFALGGLAGGYGAAQPLNDTNSNSVNLTVGLNSASTTFAGTLTGPGGLTKVGAGTLTLSTGAGTASSYGGTTTINIGTLAVANSTSPLGTGNIALAGGRLQLQGIAGTGSIGLQFAGTSSPAAPLLNTATAGAPNVRMSNWNTTTALTQATPLPLNDNNASSTTASATWSNSAGVFHTNSNTYTPATDDGTLMSGYLDSSSAANRPIVTLTNIPYSSFAAYVYTGSDTNGRQQLATATVGANSTTYFYQTDANILFGNPSIFVTTANTTNNGSTPLANYLVFNGLSNSSNLVVTAGFNGANGGITAIEIVNTTPVAPIVMSNNMSVTANSTIDVTGYSSGTISGQMTIGTNTLFVTGGSTGANQAYGLTLGTSGGVLLTGDPTFNVANNGTGTGTLTLGGVSQSGGARGITTTGSGTVVLSAAGSYSGTTTVAGGSLRVANGTTGSATGASPTLTVADGAAFGGNGTVGATATPINVNIGSTTGATLSPNAGTGIASTLAINGNLILSANSTLAYALSNSTSSGNDLTTVTGNGITTGLASVPTIATLNINAISGSLAVGTYQLITGNSVTGPANFNSWTINSSDSQRGAHAYALQIQGGNALDLVVTLSAYTWTGYNNGTGNAGDLNSIWNTSNVNWSSPTGVAAAFPNGGGALFNDTFTVGANTFPANPTVTVATGGVSPSIVFFGNTAGQASSISYTVGNQGHDAGATAGIGGPGTTVSVVGGGQVTFTDKNTYTGATSISNGSTLTISADNQLGNGSGARNVQIGGGVANNGILEASGGGTFSLGAGRGIALGSTAGSGPGTIEVASGTTLVVPGAIINATGVTGSLIVGSATDTGTLILTGANTYGGTTTINAGSTLQIGNVTATGSLGAGAVTNLGSLNFALTAPGAVPNTIGGNGSLRLLNSDTAAVTLSAINNYTGATTVNGGTLVLAGDAGNTGFGTIGQTSGLTIGTGAANSGTVQIATTNGYGGSNGATVPTVTINTGGTLTIANGLDAHLGNVILAGGTIAGGTPNAGFGNFQFDEMVTVNAGTNVTSVISAPQSSLSEVGGTLFFVNQSGAPGGIDLNVTGAIAHTNAADNGLIKDGLGTMALSNVNTFTSTTTITNGILQLGDNIAHAGSMVGPIVNNASLVFANPIATSTTYSNLISGTGTVSQIGAGTQVLSSVDNTYGGTTTISNGTLAVTNSALPLSTNTVVLSGGRLQLQVGTNGTIGVKFATGRAAATYPLNGPMVTPAGSITVWNNETGNVSTTPTPLADRNNNATTASLNSFSSGDSYSVYTVTQTDGTIKQLMNAYIDANNAQAAVTGVPYSNYSVYVFFGSDANNRIGTTSIFSGTTSTAGTPSQTFHFTTNANQPTPTYVQTTDTTGTGTGANPLSTYAVYTNQSASSFAVTAAAAGNAGIFGFEIVNTAPGPMVLSNAVNVTANSTIDVTGFNFASLTGVVTVGNANATPITLFVTGAGGGAGSNYSLALGSSVALTGTNSNYVFDVANNSTLSGTGTAVFGTLDGSGVGTPTSITVQNSGTLVLGSPASSLVAGWTVNVGPATGSPNGGNLVVSNTTGSATGFAAVNVNNGGALSGTGSIGGLVTINAGGTIRGTNAAAVAATPLILNGGLTLSGSIATPSLSSLDLSGTPSGTGHPMVNVAAGALTVPGQHVVNLTGSVPAILAPYTYDLFAYIGTLSSTQNGSGLTFGAGGMTLGTQPGGGAYSFQLRNVAGGGGGEIDVVLTPVPLTWTGRTGGSGAVNGSWDINTSTNWADTSNSAIVYTDGHAVVFADNNPIAGGKVPNTAGVATVTIVPSAGVQPAAVLFSNTGPGSANGVSYVIQNGAGNNAGITGTAPITLTGGGGQVTFAGANSFSGLVTLTAGQLNLADAETIGGSMYSLGLGNASSATVSTGATLQLQASSGASVAFGDSYNGSGLVPGALTGGKIGLTLNGAGQAGGALNSTTGNNTYAGSITVGGGGATIGSNGVPANSDGLTLGGGVSIAGGATLTFAGPGTTTVDPIADGGSALSAGSIVMNGDGGGHGTVNLVTANSYYGSTTVNSGTLVLTNASALGNSSTVRVNSGGTLALSTSSGSVTFGNLASSAGTIPLTLNGPGAGSGTFGNGALANAGTNTYVAPITVGPTATSIATTASSDVLTLSGGINITGGSPNSGSATFAPTVLTFVGPGTTNVNSVISDGGGATGTGTGAVAMIGTGGTLRVSSANTYKGGTAVTLGTLAVSNSAALGSGSLTLSGGTLQLQLTPQTPIGIQFATGRGGEVAETLSGPAGAPGAVANSWNNVIVAPGTLIVSAPPAPGGSSPIPLALLDGAGAATTASLSNYTAANTYSVYNATQGGAGGVGTGIQQLMNSYLDNNAAAAGTANPASASVTGLQSYTKYDVYVYFGSDGNNRTGALNLFAGTTSPAGTPTGTYFYTTDANHGATTAYELTTDTTGATYPRSDYAVFAGQTASSFAVSTTNSGTAINHTGIFAVEVLGYGGPTIANAMTVNGSATIDVTGPASATLTSPVTFGNAGPGPIQLSITGAGSVTAPGTDYSLSMSGGLALAGNNSSYTLDVANNTSGTGNGTLFLASLSSAGSTAATPTIVKANAGTLEVDGAPNLSNNPALTINAGNLRFNVTTGTAVIGTGVTATVSGSATLELAGTVSALSDGTTAHSAHVINNSTATAGLLVSGTNNVQTVGAIDGTGTTQVNAGDSLTANHIVQGALVIGGTSTSAGLVTIDASDSSGNPLTASSGLALAGSLTPSAPFGAGTLSSSSLPAVGGSSSGSSASGAALGGVNLGGGASAVPEPSALLLFGLGGLACLLSALRRRIGRKS